MPNKNNSNRKMVTRMNVYKPYKGYSYKPRKRVEFVPSGPSPLATVKQQTKRLS